MVAYQPRIRRYSGFVELEPQPRNWIEKHRSFATRDWLISQVKYGEWTRDARGPSFFIIETKVLEGIKPVVVLIKLELVADRARVYHCHCQRQR